MYVVNSREVLGVPRTLVTMYLENQLFKTQYMTNLTIVCPVKVEYGLNFSISGLKMMVVKSGLEKIF